MINNRCVGSDEITSSDYWSSKYKTGGNRLIQKLYEFYYLKYLPRTYINTRLFLLFKNYLNDVSQKKVLEIGSAPGWRLIEFNRRLSADVYGIDFTQNGCVLNRKFFVKAGVLPDNCIYGDFQDERFQNKYKEYFDIVVSFGLIEHFRNPGITLKSHLNFLKKDGILILAIPNLKYINNFLARILCSYDVLSGHNKEIMNLNYLKNMADQNRLETIYLDYFGVIDLCLFIDKASIYRLVLAIFLLTIQALLDIIFRIALRRKNIRWRLTSPLMVFIGKKK